MFSPGVTIALGPIFARFVARGMSSVISVSLSSSNRACFGTVATSYVAVDTAWGGRMVIAIMFCMVERSLHSSI